MYRIIMITGFATLLVLMACAPKQKLSPQAIGTAQIEEVQEKKAAQKEAWEKEWEKTIQEARKEGNVVIHVTSIAPGLKDSAPILKSKFGINLEIISRRGGEIMTAVLAERKAGLSRADILVTGTNTFFGQIEPAELAEPLEPVLILPEILNPKNWYGEELHWGNKERTMINMYAYPMPVLAVNTEPVRPEEIQSYYDLLNPKWKGKIIMNDPTIPGNGLKGFSVLGFHILNLDFFHQLAKQEPLIIRDQRLQVTWLAQGKYQIALFIRSSDITEFVEAGAPIAYVIPKEGIYLSRDGGAISLLNRAPHPNAARLLINWLLGREGQTILPKAQGVQSARVDVSTDFLDPLKKRQPGVKYFSEADSREWTARDPEYIKAAQDILGQFMR